MKQDILVKGGMKEGRLQITLSTSSKTMSVWMDGEPAERLAVAILATRFDIQEYLIIDAPKRRRRGPLFLTFRTFLPRGKRPQLSEHLLKKVERDYPDLRSQLKQGAGPLG